MSTYNFTQFNVQITNPTVTADVNTITLNPDNMSISIDVTLETANASLYGVRLEGVTVQNLNYESYANVMLRVMSKLNDFIVV